MTSLIIVNYRSHHETRQAIRTARESTSRTLQIIVVDNSCDAAEAAALEGHGADRLLVAPENLGYGRAINLATGAVTGEVVILSNPDVRFRAGSIDRLVRAAETATVAGPRFTWDDAGEWTLPPAELHSAWTKLDELGAVRSRRWRIARDRRRLAQRRAFWSARETVRVAALSGAVLAMRTSELVRLGGFDERYHLYFEETDLMRRIHRAGGRVVYVPDAVVRHLHDQSFARDPRAREHYWESERKYLLRWGGETVLKLVERFGGSLPPHHGAAELKSGEPIPVPSGADLLEVSPLPTLDTAAGLLSPSPSVRIPPEVWQSFDGEYLYARAVSGTQTLGTWSIRR